MIIFGGKILKYKKILLLTIIFVSILAVSAVNAADNATNDVVGENLASDDVSEEIISEADDLNTSDDILSHEKQDVLDTDCNDSVISQNSNESVLEATYADVYLDSITTRYNSGKYFYFGWLGYFDGYFKVYKGSSLYFNEYLDGYDDDRQWSLRGMPSGTYTAKLITYNGITLGMANIVIKKSSSKISVKSFKATAGSVFYCYAYVKDKYNGGGYNGGTVHYKINGKTYKAILKNGVAVAKIRIPNKVKTFTCKATFSGGKNVYSSSTKFKIVVKKKPKSKYKIITTSAKSYWVTKHSGKFTVKTKIWDMTAGFRAPYKYIDTTLYKNGKQVINTKYSVNYKINGKWTGWTKYGTTSTAHHRYMVYDSAKVGQVKVRVHK